MRVRVQRWGNKAAIRLPAPALEAARLTVGQMAEITVHDGGLFIRSMDTAPMYSLDQLLADITAENLNIDQQWVDDPATGHETL